MWHLPQFSGLRPCSTENLWREWKAEHDPSVPSGLILPIPVFGHVAGSNLPSPITLTSEPWHCQQPLTEAADMPSGNPGVTIIRFPSTMSARRLSKDPRILPPLEWWEELNSVTSFS